MAAVKFGGGWFLGLLCSGACIMANRYKTARYHRWVLVLVVAALAPLLSSPVYATLISTDTANAMPGWYGTLPIQFTEELAAGNVFVDASVDYAVYSPGKFNASFPGMDPSNGTQYVYRFQLHDAADSGDYLRKLSVGLVDINSAAGWFCTWIEPGPIYPSGGVAPSASQVGFVGTPPTSVNWGFKTSTGMVTAGNDSKMLIFTSSFAPTFQSATINSRSTVGWWTDDGGNQYNWWQGQLPSPVPEPATLFSLLVAGAIFSGYRVLRRKKS
jgi:hypothetical protein